METASAVPYQGFQTSVGTILIGGANDRLFWILCDKIDQLAPDKRFIDNNSRDHHRTVLEGWLNYRTRLLMMSGGRWIMNMVGHICFRRC